MAETRRPYIRPGFVMTHLANPIMRRLGIVQILAVRGRRSGKLLSVPLGKPLELGGVRYLVSGRGNTHWVRNLRAAGRAELRFHGSKEVFRAFDDDGLAARSTPSVGGKHQLRSPLVLHCYGYARSTRISVVDDSWMGPTTDPMIGVMALHS